MIHTRLTERLGIRHPILLAPMAGLAGGKLAAAISAAGGLGLIGGGQGRVRGYIEDAGRGRAGPAVRWSEAALTSCPADEICAAMKTFALLRLRRRRFDKRREDARA